MVTIAIQTPLGNAEISGDANGISSIKIREENTEITTEIPEAFKLVVAQLHEYFDGKRTSFSFPINPKGTEFQRKVWNELLQIPFGTTCSYLELSKKIGDAKAVRAVARPMAKIHFG